MRLERRAIDKINKRRDRYDVPDWQREEVWDRSKQQNLIDSILRGWKLPKFYLLESSKDPEQYDVVDGQQRLQASWAFYDGTLALAQATAREFGGRVYSELPTRTSDKFDDYEIELDVISDASDADVREFFQRLQTGLPLTSSEKLNAIPGNLRDFVRKLSRHKFFKKTAVSDKRYGHFDVCAKVAAIEIDGLDAGLRFDEMSSTFQSQSGFAARSNVARRLTATFDYLDKVFPKSADILSNRTTLQSVATLTAKFVSSGDAKGFEKRLAKFFKHFMEQLSEQVELGAEATDLDYLEFQRTVNANVRNGARIRQRILLRKLMQYDPGILAALEPGTVAETGLDAELASKADAVAKLITRINTANAAKTGEDLFKPTNKTTAAIGGLSKKAVNLAQYGTFVDDLYFVLCEGPGGRLPARPESFKDVNDLRTHLRHDVDHDKKADSAAKRRRHSKVFQAYGGDSTPEDLDADRFVLVQTNILSAVERDLGQLLKEL